MECKGTSPRLKGRHSVPKGEDEIFSRYDHSANVDDVNASTTFIKYGDFIRTVIFIIIMAIGIVFCYKANSRGDNKEFVERSICLSLPIGVRIFLLLFLVLILDIIIATVLQFGPQAVEVSIFIESIIVLIISMIWMRSYIIDVSGAGEKPPEFTYRNNDYQE